MGGIWYVSFFSSFDLLRVARLLGENGVRLRCKLRSKNGSLLNRLRERRFGSVPELSNTVYNPSSRQLITRPDKGSGTVVIDKTDHITRMESIIGDTTKLKETGPVSTCDRTIQQERSLQGCLLRMKKSSKISDEVYSRIRPVGAVLPRLYGLPKTHKVLPIPLTPILSTVRSA